LEAELEAELEARRKQYLYYRDLLLTFTDEAVGVRWTPVGELGSWTGGITPSKAVPRYWESGTIPWVASMDISASSGSEIRGRVTQAALDETPLRLIPAPSIAVVMRSNILRRVLPIGFIEVDATVNQDLRLLRPRQGIDARYAYQVLLATSEAIRQKCVRTDGSMAAVDSKALFDWLVPIPPIEEQRRIAGILDKFDTLVNDLSTGLPAEIKARRQQYEYYRDNLLTFEEAA
jgi:type I restriction enzyme S subunit